jgi:WD40 repeat protein
MLFFGTQEQVSFFFSNNSTGEQISKLGGHNKLIRWVTCSPTEQAIVSCSDDQRARFWVEKSSISSSE